MKRRLLFVCAVTAVCLIQITEVRAQVFQSRVDEIEANPFPFPEGKDEVGESLDGGPRITPILKPLYRYEIYGGGFPVTNTGANILGPVIVYEGVIFDQLGGSIRSLELAGEFSVAHIGGGTVEAFNPGNGDNGIDIAGGSVAFGSYSTENIQIGETTQDWQGRVSPLDTPTNSGIFISGGTVKAGIASSGNGDLSLGDRGFLDVSGGRVEASFGDIAGRFDISGGEFTNLSVNSLSGEINILGDSLQYEGNEIDSSGLTINDAPAQGGGQVTGTLTDGSDFSFTISDIFEGGSVNLFANNSEVDITSEVTAGLVNGGGTFAGGVEVSFDVVEEDGTFTSDAQVTDVAMLDETIEADADIDFELASEETAQHWDLGFDGTFLNVDEPGAELVFGYDPLAIDVNEEELAIFHFDVLTGEWEELEILERDLARNSLRVRTSSFSPFVLGAVTTAVPEPSGAVLVMAFMSSAVLRRRR